MENSAYNYPEEQVPDELDDFAREFTSLRNTSPRQSFTDLSQTDADLALARALQQQEHAYLLLQIGNDGSDHDATGSGSFEYDFPEEANEEEELLSSHAPIELTISHGSQQESEDSQGQGLMDGPSFDDDEAFARALQEAENREATAYMISLLGDHDLHRNDEDEIDQSQEAWQDVDPDNMTYEELIALGEAVGTQSRGLKPNAIAALPNTTFSHEDRTAEELCVICRFDYEEGDKLLTLPCKHQYHGDCIKNWLQINKTCPICSSEVKM
ncbi:hypothetical protein KP509_02G025700 [Ceratopteris richardii]|uniref:RING-type domain-containing protein n=1 Tax=Ceratopteris richardii TaxID=49495 RepID=A0A8T2VC32_CERRI|nr:hypothetical protein KP509_02G025700 [Ceratopteris richardii]KAH7443206.1 hypothetical protein KP509_02G025700 [Ceratopteris richardii]